MSPFNKDASCVIYLRSRYASGDGAVIKHCQGRSKTASQPSLSCLLMKANYLFIFHGRRVELSWRSEQVPSWSLHSVACDQSHSSDNNQRLTLDSLGCQRKLRDQPCLIICFKTWHGSTCCTKGLWQCGCGQAICIQLCMPTLN